jgi:hypothetical protein
MCMHRGRVEELERLIEAQPELVRKTWREMPDGNMALAGATLLHLAVEMGEIGCVDALLERGADINARAEIIDGIGGQTPIFHAIASNCDGNVRMLGHLADRCGRGIDLSVRATFRIYGEAWTEPVTPLEYAEKTSGTDTPVWRRTTYPQMRILQSVAERAK